MLAPNSDPKSMLPLKRKNQLNASPLAPSWVRGVQVGSKNRSKIDQKTKSRWEGNLASNFHRFLWILGPKLGCKIEPRSLKNGIENKTKNEAQQDGQKGATRNPNGSGRPPTRAPGRYPPNSGVKPSPSLRAKGPHPFFFCQSLVLSCLVFVLSSLVLSCPVLSCPVLAPFPVPTWGQLGSPNRPKSKKMDAKMPSHVDFIFG